MASVSQRKRTHSPPITRRKVNLFGDDDDNDPPRQANPHKRVRLFDPSDDEEEVHDAKTSDIAKKKPMNGQNISLPPRNVVADVSALLSPTLQHEPEHEVEMRSSQEQIANMDLDDNDDDDLIATPKPHYPLFSQEGEMANQATAAPEHDNVDHITPAPPVDVMPTIFSQEEGEILEDDGADADGEDQAEALLRMEMDAIATARSPPSVSVAATMRTIYSQEEGKIIEDDIRRNSRKETVEQNSDPQIKREEGNQGGVNSRSTPMPTNPFTLVHEEVVTIDDDDAPGKAAPLKSRSRAPSRSHEDEAASKNRDQLIQAEASAQAPRPISWNALPASAAQVIHPSQKWRAVRVSDTKSSSPPIQKPPPSAAMKRTKSDSGSALARVKHEKSNDPPLGLIAPKPRRTSFTTNSGDRRSSVTPDTAARTSFPRNGVWSNTKESANAAPRPEADGSDVRRRTVSPLRRPAPVKSDAAKSAQGNVTKTSSRASSAGATPPTVKAMENKAPAASKPNAEEQSNKEGQTREDAKRRLTKFKRLCKWAKQNHKKNPQNYLDLYAKNQLDLKIPVAILDVKRTNFVGKADMLEDVKLEQFLDKMEATKGVFSDKVMEDLDALKYSLFELGDLRSTDLKYRDAMDSSTEDEGADDAPGEAIVNTETKYNSGPMRGILIKPKTRGGNSYCLDKGNTQFKRDFKVFGNNGLKVGDWWPFQICALRDGAHGSSQGGIAGNLEHGAYSIVVSGGYKDNNTDQGDRILYSGAGGTTTKDGKVTAQQQENQSIDVRSNQYLKRSIETGKPVRVLRSGKLNSTWAPTTGLRYDGLYRVARYQNDRNALGLTFVKFTLERLPDQEPIDQNVPSRAQIREVQKYVKNFE